MEKYRDRNTIAGLLLVLAIIVGFFINILWGLLIGILSLIMCVINLRSEMLITKIIFIITLILAIYFLIVLIVGYIKNKEEGNIKDTFLLRTYEMCEDDSTETLKSRIALDYKENLVKIGDGKYVASIEELGNRCIEECDGYTLADLNTDTYKTYMTCNGYKTVGFENYLLKMVK